MDWFQSGLGLSTDEFLKIDCFVVKRRKARGSNYVSNRQVGTSLRIGSSRSIVVWSEATFPVEMWPAEATTTAGTVSTFAMQMYRRGARYITSYPRNTRASRAECSDY